MSGLRDRLLRLTKSAGRSPAAGPNPDSRDASDEESAKWARIGALVVRESEGAFIKRTIRYELSHAHGRYRLDELRGVERHIAALGHVRQDIRHTSQMLFFDTETTGLGVGAGNVPFMIGCGYVDGSQFIVDQLFIRDPREERQALAYLSGVLQRFTHMITYNGRSFDWSVLKNRYVLHRLEPPKELAQADLLYAARSLWKETLPSCRLSVIEQSKLGYSRERDLPGAEAPVRYMQFLRSRDVRDVEDIFIHNERDILSLAALTVCIGYLMSGSVRDETPVPGIVPEDKVRIAVWLDKLQRHAEARELLHEAQRRNEISRVRLLEAASLWKKWHEYDRAAACWRAYVENSPGKMRSVEPFIELAIYYEHRVRDFEAAIYWAQRARTTVERRMTLGRNRSPDRELMREIDHRLNRLRGKMGKPAQEKFNFH